ncbi:hypothetical protein, partial [Plasmodium yoelii yoelii]
LINSLINMGSVLIVVLKNGKNMHNIL